MDTPFTLSGVLNYPPDDGEAAVDRPFSLAGTFKHEANFTLELTGSGTKVIDFGSLVATGAKALLIEVDPAAPSAVAAPINVRWNGGDEDLEISQGGGIAYWSPSPTAAGITALSVIHTQAARVKIRVLG